MKLLSIASLSVLSIPSIDAIGLRQLVNKFSAKTDIHDTSAPAESESDAELAAFLQDLEAPPAAIHANGSLDEDSRRNLISANCDTVAAFFVDWSTTNWATGTCSRGAQCFYNNYPTVEACCANNFPNQPGAACYTAAGLAPTDSPTSVAELGTGSTGTAGFFYPDYETTWSVAGCLNTLPLPYVFDGDRPTYSTMLACCKGAYGGQVSGTCLAALPNPPTTSPSISGGVLDFFYPDYDTAWSVAGCSNEAPLPYPRKADRPSFDTMLLCCKGAFGGQISGACLAELPSPPTDSPTMGGGMVDFFYPDYDTSWAVATCMNDSPLPYPRKDDRPSFDTMFECCKGAYGGQASGACLAELPSPPTTSPSMGGGILDFFYPDYDTAWSVATCMNVSPLPYPRRDDRPSFDTMLACCKGAYDGQASGACLAELPSPPTDSPTAMTVDGTLTGTSFYATSLADFNGGTCINTRPVPANFVTHTTQEACCTASYRGQSPPVCMCDANPCFSCSCTGAGSHNSPAGSCPALDCGTE